MDSRTQNWYERNASELAGRYDAAEPRELHDFLALVCRPGDRVLDVGCGSGREVAWLRKRGVLARGVDASGAMIAEAGRRHPEIAEFLSQDALPALPGQTGEPADVVLATAVLMHLPPHEIFEAAFRLKQMLKL